jgi:hypothetical protein
VRLPQPIKLEVRDRLWRKADGLGWKGMTVIERAKQYGIWVEDPEVGAILANYIDPRKVHSYIKDTLMKPYSRAAMSDSAVVLNSVGVTADTVGEQYERPHGALIQGKGVVCWGKADDWKLVFLAVHERAFQRHEKPFAAVLLPPLTRFLMAEDRAVVEDARVRLGFERLVWLDPQHRLNGVMERGCPG